MWGGFSDTPFFPRRQHPSHRRGLDTWSLFITIMHVWSVRSSALFLSGEASGFRLNVVCRDLIFMMSMRSTPVQEAAHRCCHERWLLPVSAVPVTHNSKCKWVGVVVGGMESVCGRTGQTRTGYKIIFLIFWEHPPYFKLPPVLTFFFLKPKIKPFILHFSFYILVKISIISCVAGLQAMMA